ncbi:MAG: hypothetical protein K2K12_03180, partial [Clostridia bacterium]|nr:hypothetical protein [Clostridia bacterium]
GITYNVVNDKGVKYELGTDTPDAGRWYYWAATNGEWTGWTAWVTELKKAEYDNGNVTIAFTSDLNVGKTCPHGVQFKYTNPNEGTNCTFTITATQNCSIDVGEVHYNLVAGEAKQISFSGTKEFYLQVNLTAKMDISVTISNVQWN